MKNFLLLLVATIALGESAIASPSVCTQSECEITGFGASQRSLWIPNLPFGVSEDFEFDENQGLFEVFPDGTARITGVCYNMDNPDYGFVMQFHYTDKRDWSSWSALGRSWKGQAGIVGDHYLDWDYYVMDQNQENTLVGVGAFEGSVLNVTHMPADHFYGLQVGIAANDKNGEQGMSFWFNYTGTINGQNVSGHGDINLEGGCQEGPVIECPVDIIISCNNGEYLPELTGEALINCQENYTLSYSDEMIGEGCNFTIIRTWVATNNLGEEVTCEQSITVVDDLPPVIEHLPLIVESCDYEYLLENYISDNCTNNIEVSVEVLDAFEVDDEPCHPGQLRTQTIGGWGAPASGDNPGTYRDANFDAAFPNGLTIGCNNTLTLTSSAAVQSFLPAGGPSTILPLGSMTDPTNYSNTFASQLIGITLSLGFDAYDPDFGASDFALANVVYLEGTFAGMTLAEVVAIANQVIGGCDTGYSVNQLNTALTAANENYVDGIQDQGAFTCESFIECGAGVTVIITATDECGNTSTSEQVVYIEGGENSFSVIPPSNLTVECGSVPEPFIEVNAGCFSELVDIQVEESQFSGACQPTIQRIYTVTGICGFSTQFTQFITVVDHTPPVFWNSPQDLVLACGDDIPDFEPEVDDNCGISEIIVSENSEFINCSEVIVRTYTATDLCGNSSSVTQHIVIQFEGDLLPLTDFGDLTVGCGQVPPPADVAFESACGTDASVSFEQSEQFIGCERVITRVWTASDGCGNEGQFTQTITVVDEEAPVFAFVPADLQMTCGQTPQLLDAVAVDNCSEVELSLVESWEGSPSSCGVLTRVWTATDACGNSSTAQQLVTYIDTIAPVLTGVPSDEAQSCVAIGDLPEVTAFDLCSGDLPVSFTETVENENCFITITRTWSATDNCGNTTSEQQVITYTDTSSPEIIGDPEISIECAELEAALTVDVTDDCNAGLNTTFTDVMLGAGAGCAYSFERTFTAVDLCGNEAVFVQIINVVDETAPVFTFVPENVVLSCGDELPDDIATAIDPCSQVTMSVIDEEETTACGTVITRRFIASDDCGNESEAVQMIEISDFDAPVFTLFPDDRVISCNEALPAVETPEVSDNCSAVDLTMVETEGDGGCAGATTLRTWTAIDACGNQTVAVQTITRVDNTPPVFGELPADLTAECGAVPPPAEVSATDDCSDVTVSFSESTDSGGCPNIYRTWIATDACGNSVSYVQTISVEDNEPPVLTGIPPSVTASCNALPPVPEPEVSDNCDDNVSVAFVESIVGEGCFFTIIRTWIASDNCGNTTVISQSITVEDTEDPVFVNVPPVQIVDCGALPGLPLPQVTDDCGNTVTITFEDEVNGSGCNYEITRTYTATDLCGNSSTATTLLQVVDSTPPMIYGVGPNTMVGCGGVPDPNAAYAIDACSGEANIEVTDTYIGQGCSYIINRSYTATDNCGNAITITQLIFVEDSNAPDLLGVPANIEISCDDEIPTAPEVYAVDQCAGSVPVTFSQIEEDLGCERIITRIWTATDDCGNTKTAQRTVNISDTTPPQLSNVPDDVTVDCHSIPAVTMPTASDNCSEVNIEFFEDIMLGGCPYEIHRTFIATDACGNEASQTQRIFVIDNESPVLQGDFGDLTVGCGEVPDPTQVTATDNCSDVEIYVTDFYGDEGCVQVLTRTFVAVDLCGNTDEQTDDLRRR